MRKDCRKLLNSSFSLRSFYNTTPKMLPQFEKKNFIKIFKTMFGTFCANWTVTGNILVKNVSARSVRNYGLWRFFRPIFKDTQFKDPFHQSGILGRKICEFLFWPLKMGKNFLFRWVLVFFFLFFTQCFENFWLFFTVSRKTGLKFLIFVLILTT